MKAPDTPRAETLLEVAGLRKHYPARARGMFGTREQVRAVEDVSFSIDAGETLGLVGESGCGKSTVGKALLRLVEPTAGHIRWRGRRIDALRRSEMRPLRRELQAVFQDPYASLNPRMRAADIVAEPIRNFERLPRAQVLERVRLLFQRVGLRADQMNKYPYEFSGGQRQRLGIARALAPAPRLIVCDEPVSALDVSIQAQVVNLLTDLQGEMGLSYLFIAHDLAVVRHISRRVAVMYLGRIVELADKASLFGSPRHPYTEGLLSAVPVPDPSRRRQRMILTGELPSPIRPPSGCSFHPRCPLAVERCTREVPVLRETTAGHFAACHLR